MGFGAVDTSGSKLNSKPTLRRAGPGAVAPAPTLGIIGDFAPAHTHTVVLIHRFTSYDKRSCETRSPES